MSKEEIQKKVTQAFKDGVAVDLVYMVTKKTKTGKKKMVMLGHHQNGPKCLTLPQSDLCAVSSQLALKQPVFKAAWAAYFMPMEPDFDQPVESYEHVDFKGEKKLLIYVPVEVPFAHKVEALARDNGFVGVMWLEVDRAHLMDEMLRGVEDQRLGAKLLRHIAVIAPDPGAKAASERVSAAA